MPRAAALYAGSGAIAAVLWLLAADLIWSGLSPNPFQIFGWWDALVLWGQDWLTTACLAASAALPAAILSFVAHLMFRLGGAPAWATAAGSAPLIPFQSNIPAHARWAGLPGTIPLRRAVWIGLAGGLYLASFTVLASLFFLEGTGLSAAFAHPYWQWWLYAHWYFSEDCVLRTWLVVSAVAAAVVPLVPVGILLYRHYLRIYGWTPRLAMVRRAAWIAAFAGIYFAVFTLLATVLFLIGAGLQGAFAHPFWQWWLYALRYSGDPAVRFWLEASGVPAAVLPLLAAAGLWYRRRQVPASKFRRNPPPPERPVAEPIRSTTDNHGHARWALKAEAQELWPGPNPAFGGVVVGEACDPRKARGPFSPGNPATWGPGGRAPLLIDPCVEGSTHSLVVAGSGSFKTTSAVSTLLTWTGSIVVLDPAGELGPMLEAARQRMQHRVFMLSPDHAAACAFNVLDWIDIASPLAETDVRAVVEWICGSPAVAISATAEFFESRGKALVTCLLANMVWDPALPPERKTLRTLRAGVAAPESKLREILDGIHQNSLSPMARDLAGTLKELEDETFSGIAATAADGTDWLATGAFADLVSGNAFRSADVVNGDTDIFVCLPLKALQSTPGVARCIIGALLNAAYEANGAVNGRILFLLDEAFRLGRMDIIETARDAGRKYGITLQLLYQSVGQIVEQWGEAGKRAWYESASWRAYAAVKDLDTARELSATIGNYGVLAWSEAKNRGSHGQQLNVPSRSRGENVTYSERTRPLIRPEEIMHDLREDAQIIIPKRGRPVLCGRAIYFRRPEFTRLAGRNRFFAAGNL
ncbi:MAG TPA: type IV secretory system conjugative DNA transfer family protein [Stellaceae bacterium]|nr:type IV secretory system conjugative DNA transfer family protein [Stellaceae bacterium]